MVSSIRTTAIASLLLLSSLASANNLDCQNVQVDGRKFDLSKIGGPHSILVQDTEGHPSKSNTTWTVDLCQALQKPKGVAKGDTCPSYTRGEFFAFHESNCFLLRSHRDCLMCPIMLTTLDS